jgi:Fur family transcriptional regulator, ferric uptake regulator
MRLSLVIHVLRLNLTVSYAAAKLGCRMSPASRPSWTEHVHGVLARAGLKRGGARERIIGLLAAEPCALSAVEIEDELKARGTPTGRASIYRVLELLVEHGLVERIEVGDGQARFERALPDGRHHHHLVCQQCGRLVAFDDPGLERAIDSLSERLGVRIEHHDVLLRGDCRRCG